MQEGLISMSLKPPYIPTIPNSNDKLPNDFNDFISVIILSYIINFAIPLPFFF